MAEPWKSDLWFTSPWNFLPEVTKGFSFPKQVKIHDTTLRDGEQQAGVVFTKDDKIRIASMLDEAGVHRIEAGMPAVSWADAEAIKTIAEMGLKAEVFTFARCIVDDVKRASEAGVKGIILEVPSSQHLIQKAYKWPLERAIDSTIKATLQAKAEGLYTTFFPIDASRAEMTWYLDLIERIAREGHMDALALVDTMGVLTPQAVQYFVKRTKERIKKPLETHFHMDYGLGVANTIVAMLNGVETVHTTITGIGERAGNVPMEDLVLSLQTLYGVDTGIESAKLYPLSKLVRELADHPIPPNRHIVGDHLFDIESGIPAMFYKNLMEQGPDQLTEMFPYQPRLVGQNPPRILLGKGSGMDSVGIWLDRIGVKATNEEMQELLLQVKNRSLEKKGMLDEYEFRKIAEAVVSKRPAGDPKRAKS
ncbi:MAG: pyruvate carboxyltransferase [Chloroflexi bacterium]|nr:pyruvate carboxyltransferase [Chloroflexota bacterium]